MSAGLHAIGAAFAANPLDGVSWTGPQDAWVRMGSPADVHADGRPLLWLGANQIGKSYAQAGKLLHYIRRTGPYAFRRPGPVQVCILSISKEQIVPLMAKIWELLPKQTRSDGSEAPIECPGARFEAGFGFRGKPPRIRFTSGQGKGSLVTFATYKQGSSRIAGATLNALMLDEPPPEALWGEVVLRMLRLAGQIWITMTITPDSPPQEWLKKKVEAGLVRMMQTPMTVENLAPVDGSPPFLTRAAIRKARRETPLAEHPLRFDAAWDGATLGRWLSAWGPACISASPPPGGAKLLVAVDHSTTPGRQVATLVACQPGLPHRPQDAAIWVMDETPPPAQGGEMTTILTAQAIVDMLARNSLKWTDVDLWIGDRAAQMRTQKQMRADNATLRRRIADLLGVEIGRFPRIEVPYKSSGTVSGGFGEMNAKMSAGTWKVHPRCKNFTTAAERWDGKKESPHKDYLDTARYAMETAMGGKAFHRGTATRLLT